MSPSVAVTPVEVSTAPLRWRGPETVQAPSPSAPNSATKVRELAGARTDQGGHAGRCGHQAEHPGRSRRSRRAGSARSTATIHVPIRRCRPSSGGHRPPRPGRLRRPGIAVPAEGHGGQRGDRSRPRPPGRRPGWPLEVTVDHMDRSPRLAAPCRPRCAEGQVVRSSTDAARASGPAPVRRAALPTSTSWPGRTRWASGEKRRSIDGSKPAVTVAGGVIDATSPPLLATPGGVASFHRDDPVGKGDQLPEGVDRVVEVAHGHDGPRSPRGGHRRGQGGTDPTTQWPTVPARFRGAGPTPTSRRTARSR